MICQSRDSDNTLRRVTIGDVTRSSRFNTVASDIVDASQHHHLVYHRRVSPSRFAVAFHNIKLDHTRRSLRSRTRRLALGDGWKEMAGRTWLENMDEERRTSATLGYKKRNIEYVEPHRSSISSQPVVRSCITLCGPILSRVGYLSVPDTDI